jgi:hypothetical protein
MKMSAGAVGILAALCVAQVVSAEVKVQNGFIYPHR